MSKIKEMINKGKEDLSDQINYIKNSGGKMLPLIIAFWLTFVLHLIFWAIWSFLLFFAVNLLTLGIVQLLTNQDMYISKYSMLKKVIKKVNK